MLPSTLRAELERRIVERAFGGYQELAGWLGAQGYHIAHDSLQRHGSRLQQKIRRMERLASEAEASTDAAHRATDNLVNLAMQLVHYKIASMLLAHPEKASGSANAPALATEQNGERTGGIGSSCLGVAAERSRGRRQAQRAPNFISAGPLSPLPGAGTDASQLGLADLLRLTRIVGGLNQITIARRRQLCESAPKPKLGAGDLARIEHRGLSDETSRRLRDALLGIRPFSATQDGQSNEGITDSARSTNRSGNESKEES